MAKIWKIVLIIFAFALLVGCLSAGVGYITGGDADRFIQVFFHQNADDLEFVENLIAGIGSAVQDFLGQFAA